MRFKRFSPKQLTALNWWCPESPRSKHDAIICDGAVRSGKTLCLSLSFVLWSMACFSGQSFAMCGKTISSLRRNVITPLLPILENEGFSCEFRISRGMVTISFNGRENRYYLFGGKDEGSAALIQGVTLAGVFFDEVALMPRSFVEQALARCSVEGAKFWFNCNPEHPRHWFYTEWVLKAGERNVLYLHFTMEDNPSLSKKVLERYQSLYAGAFHERYVLGKWVAVHGAVYPMFSHEAHVVRDIPECEEFAISCDYGTVNPASFGLWGRRGEVWYRIREYYHDSRALGVQKTDEEYAEALDDLAGGVKIEAVIVDPSAASFIECLRRRGKYDIIPAKNDVTEGIKTVTAALKSGKLLFHGSCRDCIREFSLYRWNSGAAGDFPRKENDHAMDDMRYFAMYAFSLKAQPAFSAQSVARRKLP